MNPDDWKYAFEELLRSHLAFPASPKRWQVSYLPTDRESITVAYLREKKTAVLDMDPPPGGPDEDNVDVAEEVVPMNRTLTLGRFVVHYGVGMKSGVVIYWVENRARRP